MQQHLFSVLLAMVLGSSIPASTPAPPNASTPAANTETSSQDTDPADPSNRPLESRSSSRPLVVRVALELGREAALRASSSDAVAAPFEIDWARVGSRLAAADEGGNIGPLAFLIEIDGTSRPFETPPSSPDVGTTREYGLLLAQALDDILQTARTRFPSRPLSIVGLPIERPTAGERALAAVLNPITEQFDVLVSDRTFLQPGDSVSAATLRNALPSTTSRADGRPVHYRTSQGWTSWRDTSVVADSGSEASDQGRGTPEASLPAERRVTAAEQQVALGSPSSKPVFVDNADLPARRRTAASFADRRRLPAASDDDSGTSPFGAPNESWLDDDMAGVDPGPGSDLWSSDGLGENGIPTDVDTLPSRTNDDDPSTTGSSSLHDSVGNSVTIPTVNASPTLFPYLGSMGVDGGTATSLSDLLTRLAATTSSSTSGRPLTSRGSSAAAGGSSAAGASSFESFPNVARGGGSGGGGGSGRSTGIVPSGLTPTPPSDTAGSASDGIVSDATAAAPETAPTSNATPTAIDLDIPIDTPPETPNAANGSDSSSGATIVIPIAPPDSGSTTTPPPASHTPANTDNPPNTDVPNSPTWNPSSGIAPTTPIGTTEAVADSDASASAYRFGRHTDDLVWGYWACDPFQTLDGRLWVGVSAHALGGIDSVRFLVSGLGATSVAEVDYHPDRALDAYWIDINPSDVAGDQVSITAIVQPTGVAEPLESPPLVVDKRGSAWDVPSFKNGFTHLVPSADSRLIYIATDGDDAQAVSNQHGRPYYLPSDPEIGADPMNPVGPIRAYADPFVAVKYVRGAQYSGDRPDGLPSYDRSMSRTANGYPDWVLFRRGQSFDFFKEFVKPATGAVQKRSWGYFLGSVNPDYPTAFGHGAASQHTGGPRGRRQSEPMVVTAWGPSSEPRPVLGYPIGVFGSHIRYVSFEAPGIEFSNVGEISWIDTDGEMTDLLVEDCRFTRGLGGGNTVVYKDAQFRRCVVVDSFNPSGHNQGFFLGTPNYRPKSKEIGWDLVIEECVFDRNGYKEDPNAPTTWTNGRNQVESRPYGTGVQPQRTYFDRNLYLSSYSNLKVRGNIISRGGGGADVQMRSGGVCERNLFLMNHKGVLMGGAQDSPPHHDDGLVIDNVFLHDEHFTPPGGFTNAVQTDWYTRDLIIKDNVVARYMKSTGTAGVINPAGKQYYNDSQPAAPARFIGVVGNELDIDGGKYVLRLQSKTGTDILDFAFADNTLWKGSQLDDNPNFRPWIAISEFFEPSGNTSDEPWMWSNNDYGSSTPGVNFTLPNGDVDFATWQAAGFDSGSTFHTDRAAFEAAAGWADPDRSILTYMQAVDPNYVVNEDVYVDDGSSGQKQAVRQKVWEQLVPEFSEATAKLIARNYHAFLAFIEKARNNRKGAWDSRWTAEAVNNYIREGYGKEPLAGPYTASLDDITSHIPVTP